MPDAQPDYPLFRFPQERTAIVGETVRRALALTLQKASPEYALNDVCLHEIRRLSEGGAGPEEVRDLQAWRRLWRRIGALSPQERIAELSQLIQEYAEDVAGGFNPVVYQLASRVVPPALGVLLTPEGLAGVPRALTSSGLEALLSQRLLLQGPLERLRALARGGTLVCVPTHLSNLDSPVMGYALQLAQLPPTTYGAGKNLFTNPVLGFFMRNCGAYRVDRRIRHDLYKDVLKCYAQVLLERGYHSMFFPGGTRSRSGRVEAHLKLGLLGTTLPATVARFRRQRGLECGPAVRPIYIVPATINFQLTLEAETLVADYLKETGRARFIIDDDESAQPLKMVRFARSLLRLSGAVVVRFCEPLDVLGQPVDDQGRSLDPRGRPVDLARYFEYRGQVQTLPQRDAEYTRECAEAITSSYRRNTVLLATHLLAHVVWRRLCAALPEYDLYRRLRQPVDLRLGVQEVCTDLEALQQDLLRRGHLLGPGADGPARGVVETALRAFESYHAEPAVVRVQAEPLVVSPGDRQLLFYYQNRVESLEVR
ncbi:MAG: 1-acyl-sn-glycerol-3-phosphate acyltransferase [Myxococcales bacterium]|nr:1-acyl-sn-glycerol-3-phosphate acyltransferase [Myxococcales bacterium]